MSRAAMYLRCSRDKQDEAGQRLTCQRLAVELGLSSVAEVAEHVSGGVPWQQRAIGSWLMSAESGDVLLISEISRIARSLTGIMSALEVAMQRGLRVECASPRFSVDGSIQSAVLVFAFGLAAQIERDLIKTRTRAALAERKASGVVLGRRPGATGKNKLDSRAEEVRALLAAKVSDSAIGRMLHVSRHTVAAFRKKEAAN